MPRRRTPIPPVPDSPRHRRDWRTLWRRCICGLSAPCVDSRVPARQPGLRQRPPDDPPTDPLPPSGSYLTSGSPAFSPPPVRPAVPPPVPPSGAAPHRPSPDRPPPHRVPRQRQPQQEPSPHPPAAPLTTPFRTPPGTPFFTPPARPFPAPPTGPSPTPTAPTSAPPAPLTGPLPSPPAEPPAAPPAEPPAAPPAAPPSGIDPPGSRRGLYRSRHAEPDDESRSAGRPPDPPPRSPRPELNAGRAGNLTPAQRHRANEGSPSRYHHRPPGQ